MEGQEVKHPPVLLDVGLGVGFESVDHVRELDPVTDEKHREVVSYNVKVTLSSVKLGCKTARVSNGFRAAALVDDGGEADNDRCLNSGSSEEVGTSEVRDIMCHLKEPLGTGSPGVDNALRNPFSGEVGNFLHQMIILKQNWTSSSDR